MTKQKKELIWGKIAKEDILRKMYANKKLKDMTEEEVNQMLEDLI